MPLFKLSTLASLLALILAAACISVISIYAAELGRSGLVTRMLFADTAILLLLFGLYPLADALFERTLVILLVIGLSLILASGYYFQGYLPSRSENIVEGSQLAGDTITQNTSNGIIEVGFAYPIYTPTLSLKNRSLFTADVDIFLRILDGNGEASLFRAVRENLPDARLSVEATVNGLLSESDGYLFIPIAIAPFSEIEGKVVFIISDLNDGSTFDEAIGRSYPAEFEIRQPGTGELLYSFPMTRL